MKYFIFQMLKKNPENRWINIHSRYRKKLRNKLLCMDTAFFSSFSLYAISSCFISSVKHDKKKRKHFQKITLCIIVVNISLVPPSSRFIPGAMLCSHRAGQGIPPIGFTMHYNFDRKLFYRSRFSFKTCAP